jgi:hypothetical protein
MSSADKPPIDYAILALLGTAFVWAIRFGLIGGVIGAVSGFCDFEACALRGILGALVGATVGAAGGALDACVKGRVRPALWVAGVMVIVPCAACDGLLLWWFWTQ